MQIRLEADDAAITVRSRTRGTGDERAARRQGILAQRVAIIAQELAGPPVGQKVTAVSKGAGSEIFTLRI